MRDFQISISVDSEVFKNINELHHKKYHGRYRGVYVMYNKNNDVLYVGKSTDFARRMVSHRRDTPFYDDIHRIKLYKCESSLEMDLLETVLINELRPFHNKSKTYFKSRDRSELITDLDYEINELKQEIRYLEQDIRMFEGIDEHDYDLDGFSKKSEIEPITEEVTRLQSRISQLQGKKHRLIMQSV